MDALQPLAIYIHWPWCKAKCPYCDFNSHASTIHENTYIDGLLNELRQWNDPRPIEGLKTDSYSPTTRRIESIFFGGGTPSLISPNNLRQVIDSCHRIGLIDAFTEVTVECNPTSFDDQRTAVGFFNDLKACGVNRVSVGIQGLKPEWLQFLGRSHKVEEALATLDAAQNTFDNVNADVIYGLPQQALSEWVDQLKTLSQRGLSHISAYQLTIEPNTHFFRDVRKGLWQPVSGEIEADFFDATREVLTHAGYENYEISNFAMPGKACKHNTHIWRYEEYLGIGAGAHGRLISTSGQVISTQIVRQPEGYLKRLNDQLNLFSQTRALDAAESAQEAVFSGLRLAEGVDMEMLSKRFGIEACREAISEEETAFLVDKGLLEHRDNHLKLSRAGWPLLNSVLQRLLRPLTATTPPLSGTHVQPQGEYNPSLTVVIE